MRTDPLIDFPSTVAVEAKDLNVRTQFSNVVCVTSFTARLSSLKCPISIYMVSGQEHGVSFCATSTLTPIHLKKSFLV